MLFIDQLLILIVAILGSVLTFYVSIHLNKGNVLASAVVVLLAGILETFIPGFFNAQVGGAMAAGSYAGMVSGQKIGDIKEVMAIGVLCGVLFAALMPAYNGMGGRLGTIAAISCGTYFGCRRTWKSFLFYTANYDKQIQ